MLISLSLIVLGLSILIAMRHACRTRREVAVGPFSLAISIAGWVLFLLGVSYSFSLYYLPIVLILSLIHI